MSNITFLGLGAMGSRMATALLAAGHRVTVWNRSPERAAALVAAGAQTAHTPAKAVVDAEVVIAMLRDDDASRTVWLDAHDGALAAMPSTAVAVECSTLTVAWVRSLGEAATARGIALVDAPLAGSRPQAESKQLIFFAGGDHTVITRLMPVLTAMGSVHRVGSTGSGAAVKLAVNALFGTQVAVMAELLGLMAGCGVDLARAVEVISATPVASPALKMASAGMLAGLGGAGFKPMFPLELVEKDFSYVCDTAKAADCPLPITTAARAVFARSISAGLANDHITGIVQLYGTLPGATPSMREVTQAA